MSETLRPAAEAIDFAAIRRAAARLDGHVVRTPTVAAPALSRLTGAEILLKLENMQATASFKDRGAFCKLASLDAESRRRGVIALSAGNHAQGVAYHAQRLGVPATIVMPRFTPFTKLARTEAFGARIELIGDSPDDALPFVEARIARDGVTLVHPFDDPLIIAGQGTVGLEMLTDQPDIDTLIVPVGGGGLISGVALAARALKPGIRIIGVEAALYPSMADALAGRRRPYSGSTIAEGIAVKQPGRLTRKLVAALVDEMVAVSEASLERAIQILLTEQKLAVEGAGAAGLAALLDAPERFQGRRVGLVICGGNIDPRILSSILMRGLAREGRLARLRVEIDDSPGALARVAGLIGEAGGNIVEVFHLRLTTELPVKRADVDVIVEARDRAHLGRIIDALEANGFGAKIRSSLES